MAARSPCQQDPHRDGGLQVRPIHAREFALAFFVDQVIRGTDSIDEYRIGGRLYKQRVQPASGPAYYLIDEKGEGKFTRVDGPDLKTAIPMWVLLTW